MLHLEHSAILLTFIKLQFFIKIFVLSFLSGRFTQVLLLSEVHLNICITRSGQQYTSIWWYLRILPVLHRLEVVDTGVNTL